MSFSMGSPGSVSTSGSTVFSSGEEASSSAGSATSSRATVGSPGSSLESTSSISATPWEIRRASVKVAGLLCRMSIWVPVRSTRAQRYGASIRSRNSLMRSSVSESGMMPMY